MSTISVEAPATRVRSNRFLDVVERLGNKLPDPVAIFVIIIVLLMAVSALGAALGWSAVNPVTGEQLVAKSLLSERLVRQLLDRDAADLHRLRRRSAWC